MDIYSLSNDYPIFVLTGSPIQFSTDNKDCMKRILLILLTICLGIVVKMNAQSRLYPPRYLEPKSSSAKYHKIIDTRLLNGGDYTYFAFEILPSFSAESGCYYDDNNSVLVLRTANQSIWYSMLGGDGSLIKELSGKLIRSIKRVRVTEYRCSISKEAVLSFKRLFYAAVNSSSYLADGMGLDGTTYRLFGVGGVAEFWSPQDNESNCGKLEKFLYSLCAAVKNNNPQEIDNLIPLAEELTENFKSLYPEDLKEKGKRVEGIIC